MLVEIITQQSELDNLLNNNKKVIIYFTATWCGPCKMIHPLYSIYANDTKYESIYFIKIDVDDSDEICQKYQVKSMPTFIMFVDGVEQRRVSGASPKKLEELLNENV